MTVLDWVLVLHAVAAWGLAFWQCERAKRAERRFSDLMDAMRHFPPPGAHVEPVRGFRPYLVRGSALVILLFSSLIAQGTDSFARRTSSGMGGRNAELVHPLAAQPRASHAATSARGQGGWGATRVFLHHAADGAPHSASTLGRPLKRRGVVSLSLRRACALRWWCLASR